MSFEILTRRSVVITCLTLLLSLLVSGCGSRMKPSDALRETQLEMSTAVIEALLQEASVWIAEAESSGFKRNEYRGARASVPESVKLAGVTGDIYVDLVAVGAPFMVLDKPFGETNPPGHLLVMLKPGGVLPTREGSLRVSDSVVLVFSVR